MRILIKAKTDTVFTSDTMESTGILPAGDEAEVGGDKTITIVSGDGYARMLDPDIGAEGLYGAESGQMAVPHTIQAPPAGHVERVRREKEELARLEAEETAALEAKAKFDAEEKARLEKEAEPKTPPVEDGADKTD